MSHEKKHNIIDLARIKVACSHCSVRQLCLPMGVTESDLVSLEKIVRVRRRLARGEHLFVARDAFHSLYAIRSGAAKTYIPTESGEEQVMGFHLSGDLIGLDGIYSTYHACSAVMLDTTSVCEIPMNELEELAHEIPSLQHHLLRLMSKEINSDEEGMVLLGKKSADERLATFLWNLGRRFGERGYSTQEFHLPMTRSDIASYLGLALETVSRLLGRLQEQGTVGVDGKYIHIYDVAGLRDLAGISPEEKNFGGSF